jgi:pimeloyl-ACP methyl ester carboxylesterase
MVDDVLSAVFHPRTEKPVTPTDPRIFDGTIPVEEGIVVGYRLYAFQKGAPVILYFHGNGEVASDYDVFASEFHRIGASLLVVDYRGYGWSTGAPTVSAMLKDTEPILAALPGVLLKAGLAGNILFVMGRSLGSAPAIHIASQHPDVFKGLIIESGFAYTAHLLARLGLPSDSLTSDPIDNLEKIKRLTLPLLVIHGVQDVLLPIFNGQVLFDGSPAALKTFIQIDGAGHNTLMVYGLKQYFSGIAHFIARALDL